MKNFATVIQTEANKFDVFKFNAPTQKALYPQTSKVGVTVAVFESTEQNDKYCFELAEKMNANGK
jgi:hypothetical protein